MAKYADYSNNYSAVMLRVDASERLNHFQQYYHHERIHQSLGRIIEPKHKIDDTSDIVCVERLGGLLKSYHRLAA